MLKINGLPIPVSNQFKFLGVTFDRRLTWTPHVNYLKTKCLARINILRRLTGVYWGSSMHTQMLLYKALVKSVILYGSVVLGGLSDSCMRKLETIQMRAITIATGAISSTCSVDLLALVGEPPLRHDILYKIYCLGIRASYQFDTYISDAFRGSWHQSYGDYTSRYTLLQDLYLPFATLIKNHARCPSVFSELGPWQLQAPSIDMTIKSYGSKDENPNIFKSVADILIQNNNQYLSVLLTPQNTPMVL